jgi:hypothetical protein
VDGVVHAVRIRGPRVQSVPRDPTSPVLTASKYASTLYCWPFVSATGAGREGSVTITGYSTLPRRAHFQTCLRPAPVSSISISAQLMRRTSSQDKSSSLPRHLCNDAFWGKSSVGRNRWANTLLSGFNLACFVERRVRSGDVAHRSQRSGLEISQSPPALAPIIPVARLCRLGRSVHLASHGPLLGATRCGSPLYSQRPLRSSVVVLLHLSRKRFCRS